MAAPSVARFLEEQDQPSKTATARAAPAPSVTEFLADPLNRHPQSPEELPSREEFEASHRTAVDSLMRELAPAGRPPAVPGLSPARPAQYSHELFNPQTGKVEHRWAEADDHPGESDEQFRRRLMGESSGPGVVDRVRGAMSEGYDRAKQVLDPSVLFVRPKPVSERGKALNDAAGNLIDTVEQHGVVRPLQDALRPPTQYAEAPPTSTPGKIAQGVGQGVTQVAEGLTTPQNLALLAGTEGLGLVPKIGALLPRAVSGYFGAQMFHDAYTKIPEAKRAIDQGDVQGAAQAITEALASGALGTAATMHAVSGGMARGGETESAPRGAEGPVPKSGAPSVADFLAETEGSTASAPRIPIVRAPIAEASAKPADNISAESKPGPVLPRSETLKPDVATVPGTVRANPDGTKEVLREASIDKIPPAAPNGQPLEYRAPSKRPAVGRDVTIAISGEDTKYPARYAIREASDVHSSHNAFSFEPNPSYQHTNDRDYSQAGNAARVVEQANKFNPEFLTTEAPTAEHGPTIVDANGNAIGGNSRAMSLARVYQKGGETADAYRDALRAKAGQYGIDPKELDRFDHPVLVRELPGGVDAQKAITDFNKTAAADLTPEERAVSDGRRLSDKTVQDIAGRLGELGEGGTMAEALRGENGAEFINSLVRDGLITPQEKGGYLDDRGFLTPEAKSRVAKALVGRLFNSPAEFRETKPEMRAKLERIASHVLRVEGRPDWSITGQVREAVAMLEDARSHRMKLEDLAQQTSIGGRRYSPEARQIAEALQESPRTAEYAFRRYANDETLSREGAQAAFFEPPTRQQAFADAFDRESSLKKTFHELATDTKGSFSLADLKDGVRRLFPKREDADTEANYSGLGAWKSKWVRNLSQLEEASPKGHEAAVRAASSSSQASALIAAAAPKIEAALGKDGPTFKEFRQALIESRLRGLRHRWKEFARQAEHQTDEAVKGSLDRGVLDLLKNVQGKRDLPTDLAQTAASLAERKDWTGLRALLSTTFQEAANHVATVLPEEEYSRITKSDGFRKALPVYKKLLEDPIAQNHALNEGIFSSALGPLDTYYPLVPMTGSDRAYAVIGKNAPYRKPQNIANRMATGLGQEYDPEMSAFADRLRVAMRANNKASMLQTLEDEGLVQRLKPGQRPPDTVEYQGREFPAEVVEAGRDRTIVREGKLAHVPAEKVALPAFLRRELAPILEREGPAVEDPGKIRNLITRIQLSGPLDFAIHSSNLVGTLVANTPFLGESFAAKAAGSLPFAKRFVALVKIAAADPMSGEAAKDLHEMGKLGILPRRFATETYSRHFAAQTGAELNRLSLGPALYGPKGIDVRARLVMYRLAKDINPDAKPAELTKFVNQLGNYTRELQGEVERAVKSTGYAPFYTAGSTMLRNGINAWLGIGPMPKDGATLRVAQQLSGGAAGLVGMWSLAYKSYTGKWPWEDAKARFLKIPVNAQDRRSTLGRMLWGKGPETGYIDFSFFSPLVSRGARALGISGAFDTAAAHGSAGQVAENAVMGTINSLIHPLAGPPVKAAWTAATGTDLYLTGMRDDRGRPAPQFMPEVKKTPFGLPTLKARAAATAYSLNSFFGNLAVATGFGNGLRASDEKGNHWLRMVTDLAAPQLVARPQNPFGRQKYLEKQRAAAGQ